MRSRRSDMFLPLGHARGHPNPWVACIGLAHETNGGAPDSKAMLPEGFHCVRGADTLQQKGHSRTWFSLGAERNGLVMAAETRRARRSTWYALLCTYVQNTTLRYSRMFDKDLLPPSATASHSSGRRRRRAHPHCHLSSVQRTEYSTQQSQYRGTRYRGFPGHEGRQTRHFSAKSESFSLGRAQQLSVCGLRRRRRVRRIRRRALCSLGTCRAAETQARSEMSWSHEPICSVGLGSSRIRGW